MSALEEVTKLLPSLTPAEKAQLLRQVTQGAIAFPGIESDPAVCGGDPCIIRTRIPVWTLARARQLGLPDSEILRAYPALRTQDLVNAWSYVVAPPDEVQRQIQDNEAA